MNFYFFMILDQAALIPPALNGVNAIFKVAVIRAGVKGAGVKLGPAELRPIRYFDRKNGVLTIFV